MRDLFFSSPYKTLQNPTYSFVHPPHMVDQMKMDNVIALEERPAYTLTGKELATIVVLLMKDMGIIPKKDTHVVNRIRINGIRGLANYINCSIGTAQKLKNSGKIPFYNLGSKVFFYSDEVDIAVQNQLKMGGLQQ